MRLQKIIKSICLIMMLAGLVEVIIYMGKSKEHDKEENDLVVLYESQSVEETTTVIETESETVDEVTTETEPQMLDKFLTLYAENDDIVGWLSIEDTRIDYPVMQSPSDADEYYLHRNYDREEDKYGCLYVRAKADVFTPGTNNIIYGHNMKDGAMFGTLRKYESKDYYLEHPEISFDTLYDERTYEIMAVFFSQVYNEDDDVFKYYNFYQANNEDEFNYFYDNVKQLALYDTGVEAIYGDSFITLSTCSYQVEDGRFVVVAKLAK